MEGDSSGGGLGLCQTLAYMIAGLDTKRVKKFLVMYLFLSVTICKSPNTVHLVLIGAKCQQLFVGFSSLKDQ